MLVTEVRDTTDFCLFWDGVGERIKSPKQQQQPSNRKERFGMERKQHKYMSLLYRVPAPY